MTIVLWIVVLALIGIPSMGLAQVIAALPVLALALYWVFYGVRIVFSKSQSLQGKWQPSIGYGLLYTVLYNGLDVRHAWMGGLFTPGCIGGCG